MISKQMESCASSFKTLAFKTRDFQEKNKLNSNKLHTKHHFILNRFFFFFSGGVIQDAEKKAYMIQNKRTDETVDINAK